jgi:lactam utilization protein B
MVHQRELERDMTAARAQLDEATWAAAWAAGQAMTLEQAIAYALEENVDVGIGGCAVATGTHPRP